jgi:hypothetical protein
MIITAPIQIVHVIISIPVFCLGLYVIWHNKKYGHMLRDFDLKRFKTFAEGSFFDGINTLSKYGYHRFIIVFLGLMVIILGWIIAVGTVYVGDAAQDYQYSQQSGS